MGSKPKTKNDIAWEKLFSKYNITDEVEKHGYYEIDSKKINEFREARLMTKFDHRSNLPILFEKNKLAILPITRGTYIISNFEAYHDFEKPNLEVHKVTFPGFIESIEYEHITSEAIVINTAYLTGILADFTEDEELLPTVSGRMSSEKFDFEIYNRTFKKPQSVHIESSQLEIDGGYESPTSLALIEAKNSISDDFIVRQLYYPYRLFNSKISKPIKPIFLIYSNGIYYLYEYSFQEPGNYNSLVLVKQKNYTLEKEDISLDEIVEIHNKIEITEEPTGIPFPQANNFSRVVNICELLDENETLTREEITYKYDFDIRQTNYYTDACRYLGLVRKERDQAEGIRYFLTDKGKAIIKLHVKGRNLAFTKCILEKRAFNEVFKMYLKTSRIPQKNEIVEVMKISGLYNIKSLETFERRSSTISGWIKWILSIAK